MEKAHISDSVLHIQYLDYVNNFISVMAFASHHGMTEKQADLVIEQGRIIHDAIAKVYQEWDK